ncbi:hypothetical protein X777_14520, partial [Ooceraea biroi]
SVDRAILLSDTRFHDSNITIVNILSNNGYPVCVVKKFVRKRLNHIKQMSYYQVDRNNGFKVLFTIPKKLDRMIRRGKDTLPKDKQTNVVYRINCLQYDASYVGQTKRHVETRLKEHRADVKKVVSDQSVVSKHRLTFNHEFDWSDPDVLHRDAFNRRREIAEMINCLQCDASYVGQTKRHVETRLKEHRADVRKVVSDQSVVSKHRLTFNHEFDWSDPDVLHRDAFNRRREIAEMYFIKKQDRPVNLQKDADSL